VRILSCWALLLVMLAASFRVTATPLSDGGGRDVSVALFSTHSLHAVTVTPVGANSWIARCARCAHEPLTAAVHIAEATEIFTGGALRVTEDATRDVRTGVGLWHIRARAQGGALEIDVVLTLPSERYVAAVLNAEAASGEPAESLQALAVVARTYALNGNHFVARRGHLAASLCDSTECEAVNLGPVSRAIEDAVRATAGETLWFERRRAEVFFSQSCGGMTEAAGAVWSKLRGLNYLRSHADPYCVRRDTAQWHAEVPLAKLAEIAQTQGWQLPANIVSANVTQRNVSHRASSIAFTSGGGATSIVAASALRFAIGRALGWNYVRSDAYEIGVRNGALVFDGRGHGHGVGLCQQGATEMASEGRNARAILAFYFPGTAVRVATDDQGWRQVRAGALTLRSTHPFAPERNAEIEQLWVDAQRRFPPRHAIMPQIVFAPSSEIFRQLTTQPGWVLASMRGSTIVLQPEAVLYANGHEASGTLLHEMLHVLIEDEASGKAPMWLREGLVEVLADEPKVRFSNAMPAAVIERALIHADSLRESQLAHLRAAAQVHALVARYGLSTVRGWLSSGVPPGVE
jgi:stage II sporulation protein D